MLPQATVIAGYTFPPKRQIQHYQHQTPQYRGTSLVLSALLFNGGGGALGFGFVDLDGGGGGGARFPAPIAVVVEPSLPATDQLVLRDSDSSLPLGDCVYSLVSSAKTELLVPLV